MDLTLTDLHAQLRDLAQRHRAGALAGGADDEARRAVAQRLADLLLAEPLPKWSRRLVAWVATSVVGIGVAGYMATGHPEFAYLTLAASNAPAPPPSTATAAPDAAVVAQEVDKMVATLAARLAREPDDAAGWQMLARSYSALGRAAEAVPAYERAVALSGNDAALLADAADAIALRNQSHANAASDALVARALAIDPTHPKALALAGTSAFERADYGAAIAFWERMLKAVPDGSPDTAWLRENIAEARRRGG